MSEPVSVVHFESGSWGNQGRLQALCGRVVARADATLAMRQVSCPECAELLLI